MTEEIKRKISDAVTEYTKDNHPQYFVVQAYTDGLNGGYRIADERIKVLEGLLSLTESQRKEWADACIEKEKIIQRLTTEIHQLKESSHRQFNFVHDELLIAEIRISELEKGLSTLRTGIFKDEAAVNGLIDELLSLTPQGDKTKEGE